MLWKRTLIEHHASQEGLMNATEDAVIGKPSSLSLILLEKMVS